MREKSVWIVPSYFQLCAKMRNAYVPIFVCGRFAKSANCQKCDKSIRTVVINFACSGMVCTMEVIEFAFTSYGCVENRLNRAIGMTD